MVTEAHTTGSDTDSTFPATDPATGELLAPCRATTPRRPNQPRTCPSAQRHGHYERVRHVRYLAQHRGADVRLG